MTPATVREIVREAFKRHAKSLGFHYDGDPFFEGMIELVDAAVRAERPRIVSLVQRLKMARFVLHGLGNMYPETRRSSVVRQMIAIISAELAANTDFDVCGADFDAALRAPEASP